MASTQSFTSHDQKPISIIDPVERIPSSATRDRKETSNRLIRTNPLKTTTTTTTWIERLQNYFTTNDGRIILSDLFFTLTCVILQHVMGTCEHSIGDGTNLVKWHVFTPPFGAGPHTAVFFFVLSWTVLSYCIERIWVYLTTGVHVSKKRDLIVHGIIVILFFTALGFNIWGYVLCESTSQVNASKAFSPGVCRGESKACIPLIAGVLASCAAGCAFFTEHILALTHVLKDHQDANEHAPSRILL